MRYGDLNPVRARLVHSAGHWRWSSHRHYAYGEPDDLITDAPEYLALGRSGPERRKAYLHLFANKLIGPFLARRRDLVDAPFIGDESWVAVRCAAAGLPGPS
jgi:putative transposase